MGYKNCQTFTISSCFAQLMLSSAILTLSWQDISSLAVLRQEKRDEISRRWQSWCFDDATRYLVVGSQRVKILFPDFNMSAD